ncbi:MAG: feruloyl-CoA synthase [Paracoccaceae bacterium]|jgi:feruloyl-CoA synthase
MGQSDKYQLHDACLETRLDGVMLLRSNDVLGAVAPSTGTWLHQWADQTPDAVFIAERSGAGWRRENYRASLEKIRALAASLLARGLTAKTPIIILSGNGVDHALLTLAAQYIGVPTVPVAEQYSLISGAHPRLIEAVQMVRPVIAYVDDANRYAEAISLDIFDKIEIIATNPGTQNVTSISDLLKGDASADLNAAFAAVGPDTVAKILMTSGSTSSPKGVLTTQRMMCTNQTQIADALPMLRQRPPVIVDWLPWNHVFGGSHNFNMMLANGGSLYIDDGKPLPKLFPRTVENLGMMTGTLSFNVPVGFSMLLDALRADDNLSRRFFADLDMIFYAGASLPQEIWSGLEGLARKSGREMPLVTSSWGLTETAPAVLMQHELTDQSGIVGVPLNGTTIKMMPDPDGRCEVRVKGPNIMTAYFENPEKTAESFDDEGYFITGDAMVFVDANDPNKGLRFDGRISEDFKLLTGTWVRAANLRLDMLSCLSPFAADVVITGHDRAEIGVLVFPNIAALEAAGYATTQENGVIKCPKLNAKIAEVLAERAARVAGSSSRITRALVLSEPPSLTDAEVTAKGNLNFRKVLSGRADLLERLYDNSDRALIRL